MNKLKSRTMKDLIKVFSGNALAQGLGFILVLIVSRHLGPEKYGQFSILLSIYTMCCQFSDFGLSTSSVKYGSELKNDCNEYKSFLITTLIFRIILSIIISFLIFIFSDKISYFFFEGTNYKEVIDVLAISICFNSVFQLILTHYQTIQDFRIYSMLNISNQLIKILSMFIFISCSFQRTDYYIYVYTYSFLFSVLLFLITNIKYLNVRNIKIKIHYLTDSFNLGLWIFLSSLSVMIVMRINVLMLQKLSTQAEVGYYSAALQLAMAIPLITSSLTITLLPKVDEFLENYSLIIYMIKILKNMKYGILFIVLIEIISPYLIKTLFGIKYENSIVPYQLMVITFTFGIMVNPLSILFYTLKKGYLLTILNWIQLPLIYILNLYLIPLYAATGAATSSLITDLFGVIFILLFLLREVRQEKLGRYVRYKKINNNT